MTGYVPESDADAIYRLCDFVVLPYTQVVGNASACNLAMGYAKPVIASKMSPFTEEIADGQQGILCSPQDSEQILGAMEKLSADTELYTDMSRNLLNVKASRDWEVTAQITHSLYESAIAASGLDLA